MCMNDIRREIPLIVSRTDLIVIAKFFFFVRFVHDSVTFMALSPSSEIHGISSLAEAKIVAAKIVKIKDPQT